MLELIVMFRDECGDDRRACGKFSGQVFKYPRFDENNKHMSAVFEAWKESIITECENEWNAIHDIPMYFFMEETSKSYFKSLMLGEW